MNDKQRPSGENQDEVAPPENRDCDELGENSLSRGTVGPQPSERDRQREAALDGDHHNHTDYPAHVVLYQPEIPQNTGNIGRSCVAVGAKLWIVRPAGFRIDNTRLRRAGLDYWQHLALGDAVNWDDLLAQLAPRRFFYLSRFAERSIWDASFATGDVFVFGSESSGLPESILDPHCASALRLPTSPQVRSLNLATTVGVVLYEHQRQITTSNELAKAEGRR